MIVRIYRFFSEFCTDVHLKIEVNNSILYRKMTKFIRGRCCVFTVNNPTKDDEKALMIDDLLTYYIIGHEEGDSGTYHWQGYAQFSKAITLKNVKKYLPRAHIERVIGTQKQAIDYCKKDGHFDEYGTLREHGGANNDGSANKKKYSIIKTQIIEEKTPLREVVLDCDNGAQIKYAEMMEKYGGLEREIRNVKVFWYFGPTGKGKTRTAFEMVNKDSYWMSSENLKWFDGYCGQKDVIIDDFRGDFATFHFLLRLLDIYPLQVPVKGGFVRWSPERIFITCPYAPKDVYTGIEDKKQLYRRISEIRYFGNSLEDIMPGHNEADYEVVQYVEADDDDNVIVNE